VGTKTESEFDKFTQTFEQSVQHILQGAKKSDFEAVFNHVMS